MPRSKEPWTAVQLQIAKQQLLALTQVIRLIKAGEVTIKGSKSGVELLMNCFVFSVPNLASKINNKKLYCAKSINCIPNVADKCVQTYENILKMIHHPHLALYEVKKEECLQI